MEKEWLVSKLKDYNETRIGLKCALPQELHERLETFVDDLFMIKGLAFHTDDIVIEALNRFLPPADELKSIIESLPYPDKDWKAIETQSKEPASVET
jgi:hypothetical protein